jgi:hypothetical protein
VSCNWAALSSVVERITNRRKAMARRELPTLGTVKRPETVEFTPTASEVRSRAYELYRARLENGVGGDAMADWLTAEGELKARGCGGTQTERE